MTIFHVCYNARSAQMWGGRGGVPGLCGGVPGPVRVFMLACDLTRKPDLRFCIPVHIPFLQGNRELRYADNLWVGPRYRALDLTVHPPLYLRKGFVIFLCHDSTQLLKYDQGLPTYHYAHWNNKWWKVFLLFVTLLTMLFLFDIFPLVQGRCNLLILVWICVNVAKFDINDDFNFFIP